MWINVSSAALRVPAIFVQHVPISSAVIWTVKMIHLSQARKNIFSDSETAILLHFAILPWKFANPVKTLHEVFIFRTLEKKITEHWTTLSCEHWFKRLKYCWTLKQQNYKLSSSTWQKKWKGNSFFNSVWADIKKVVSPPTQFHIL